MLILLVWRAEGWVRHGVRLVRVGGVIRVMGVLHSGGVRK